MLLREHSFRSPSARPTGPGTNQARQRKRAGPKPCPCSSGTGPYCGLFAGWAVAAAVFPVLVRFGLALRSALVAFGDAAGVDLSALGSDGGELCEAASDVVATVANASAVREASNVRI